MKFSRDHLILVLLALALLLAMVLTLWFGGNRSRHGYGYYPGSAPEHRQLAQGGPLSTGSPRDCQDQIPPYML